MKEKSVRTGILLDFYGNLLTDKMREACESYYNEDLSLAEIAESSGISRQGVYDTIHRAEKQLEEYEERLREYEEGLYTDIFTGKKVIVQ